MKKKSLSVLLALCLVLTLLPGMALAEDGTTLQSQINSANSDATVALTENTTESITIPSGKNITLDLAGYTLTNEANKHTITVALDGTLTIIDSSQKLTGQVDNVSHARSAVYNNGTVVLKGGSYLRSQENGSDKVSSGGNSYYNILNHGVMTIDAPVKVSQSGGYSSMLVNGYYNYYGEANKEKNPHSNYIEGTNQPEPTLTINGGTFDGGLNTIKNDDGGVVTINGGTFKNIKQHAVFNVNKATINGGTFATQTNADSILYNRKIDEDKDVGQLTVAGGIFTTTPTMKVASSHDTKIIGGVFADDVNAYVPDTHEAVAVGSQYAIAVKSGGTAEVGGHQYETLANALTVAKWISGNSGVTTVTLLKNSTGAGVQFPAPRGTESYVIDLGGHTYTVTKPTVGSYGTETNAFQMIKGNNITFKNGTLKAGEGVEILLQNYCNLTLDGVTVDCRGSKSAYALSNNHGNITIKGATNIYAKEGGVAFDLWYGMSETYKDGITVTVDETMTGTIQGKIEYGGENLNKDWASGWQNRTKLIIKAGSFKGDIVASSSNALDGASIEISGGYFTSDPSAYLAEGKAAVESDNSKYAYMVGTKGANAAEVVIAAPEAKVELPADASEEQKETAENVTDALKDPTAPPQVSTEALDAAAKTIANSNTLTPEDEAVKTALDGIAGENDEITIVVQPYLDIKVTDVQITGTGANQTKTVTLDIAPMYKTVATTADLSNSGEIKTTGNDKNAAEIPGASGKLTITKPVTITIPLPKDFVTKGAGGGYPPIYINHVKGTGASAQTYTYKATVTDNSQTGESLKLFSTFNNPHGFSEFTLTTKNTAVAEIGEIGYDSLQAAVDAVENNGTIKILADDAGQATVNRTVKFTVDPNSKSYTINLGAFCTDKDANEHVYDIVYAPVGGGGASTYAVTVEKASNGGVSASVSSATSGRTVTLTVKADQGYVLDALTVTGRNGQTVAVTKTSPTTYTFVMPAYAVTVKATFKEGEHECPSAKFTDVSLDAWYHEAVDYAVETGLMNGVSDISFAPEGATSRGMIVTMLWRLEKEPVGAANADFSDVADGAWYAKAIDWAVANEIVTGYGDGTFGPDDAITREQLASILWRYAKYKDQDVSVGERTDIQSYADAGSVNAYAVPAIRWAVGAGIMNGKDGSRLDPLGGASRAETATMFQRMFTAK